jgi:hypothetical protein
MLTEACAFYSGTIFLAKYLPLRLFLGTPNQREGMGLLEYQAMPSLRDKAHVDCLCTNTY